MILSRALGVEWRPDGNGLKKEQDKRDFLERVKSETL